MAVAQHQGVRIHCGSDRERGVDQGHPQMWRELLTGHCYPEIAKGTDVGAEDAFVRVDQGEVQIEADG
jgi:hypothetical protein